MQIIMEKEKPTSVPHYVVVYNMVGGRYPASGRNVIRWSWSYIEAQYGIA